MSETTITKKRSILKILCKESALLHAIAIIIFIVGAISLDYMVSLWEIKAFSLRGGKIIVLYMFLNAMVAFIVYMILVFLLNRLKGGITQMIALIHYCYLPLTESEVRGRFISVENYLRYMENKLEYKKYYFDDSGFYNYTYYKIITEDDIRKILQVCHKVFGSGSIFFGIRNNRRNPDTAGYDWLKRETHNVMNGMVFAYKSSKKVRHFIDFMDRYAKSKELNCPFEETSIINEDGTVTLSYSYKYGKKMDKIDTISFTF